MYKVEFIVHKGVRILNLDLRESRDINQNIEAFQLAQKLATKEPLKSLHLLTDVTDAPLYVRGRRCHEGIFPKRRLPI